ncbi:MAG: AAA family ATPase, partial [Bacilli bacterium]
MIPLAYQLRPTKLDDLFGQSHLIGPKGVIRKMIANHKIASFIFYGNPGVGKTTLARVICHEMSLPFATFNASTDNKATLKSYIDQSSQEERFVLIIDEIHRMKKDIQDYLLESLESGQVIIIGLTTINPYHSVNPAIRSRCLIYKLNDLSIEDLTLITLSILKQLGEGYTLDEEAINYLVHMANGDVRFLINSLEGISFISNDHHLTLEDAKTIIQKPSITFSK